MYRKNNPEIAKWLKRRFGFSDEEVQAEIGNCYTDAVARCLSLAPIACEDGLTISLIRGCSVVDAKIYHRSQLEPIKEVVLKPRIKREPEPKINESGLTLVAPDACLDVDVEDEPNDHGWIDA